jgi:hypothetical protein
MSDGRVRRWWENNMPHLRPVDFARASKAPSEPRIFSSPQPNRRISTLVLTLPF